MAVILILSIMVNMLAILAVMILYSRQNRLIQFERNYKESIEEMEELINTFIYEMKEENNEIKQLFRNRSVDPAKDKHLTEVEPDLVEQELPGLTQGYRQQAALHAYINSNGQSGEINRITEKKESVQESREMDQNHILAEALTMKNQGRTIEEIAKKMERGKTEIDLLFKLNKK